jgi:hypothetical protein
LELPQIKANLLGRRQHALHSSQLTEADSLDHTLACQTLDILRFYGCVQNWGIPNNRYTSKFTIQWGQASSTIKFWGPVFSDKPTINGSMRTPAVDVRRDDNPKCGQWFLCTWKLYKLYTYSETVHQQWVVDATPNRQLRELICRGSMVSSGMAAHDVESPFRSCPFQITPTTISPTHHWSLPLVWIDSQGQSAAGVGTDYLLYNHIIYIIYMYIIIYCIYI